ncbi:m7GpppX diphosphatase [Diorhabda sublineata]|uniref:m7GpppX diphosphatase n=1 Tax=Diorhabda sublineata TaxID=1163346 RepID=UPI0024E08C1B|nr:m7GpppX diphosphatase [Diorhabda sublineata]
MSALHSVDSAESPIPKRIKLDIDEKTTSEDSIHNDLNDLSSFNIKSVLSNNTNLKRLILRGTFDSKEGDAVVILQKTAFEEEDLASYKNHFTDTNPLEKTFQNDIYGDYKYFADKDLSVIKTTVIHPATEKHIIKFSTQKLYIVDETPAIYKEVVLPQLTDESLHLQWVYNIIEHKSEVERIIFEDTDPDNGFVMLPDLKWNGHVNTLYLLAVINRRDIKSMRDLTGNHLELLRNIKKKGVEAIKAKFGLDESRLRIYLHYHPSFYHLHIHFGFLQHDAPGILTEKAHLLSQVINNIELLPDYYQKATIPFVVRENDVLCKKLQEHGVLNIS